MRLDQAAQGFVWLGLETFKAEDWKTCQGKIITWCIIEWFLAEEILKVPLVSNLLPKAGTPLTRPLCSNPYQTLS